MRILSIEPATNYSGGVNQLIINVLGLKNRGYDVVVACVENSPVHLALKDKGIDFVFIDEERIFWSALRIRRFLKRNNIDVIHTHHSKGHTIGLLSVSFRKKEKLVVQRSVLFPTTNVFKYLNPRVDLFIANSKAVKEVMRKHFVNPKKIEVLYSAVDENKLKGIERDEVRREYGLEGNVFGVVGNYSSFKGHDIALEAFKKLNLKNSMLVLVGRDTEKLKKVAKELKIESRVRILGFRKDAYKIIAGLDLLLIPSLRESFPNVAIEAFLLKVPVVGTNVGGIPELLGEGRGIVCFPEPNSMAKAIMDMVVSDRKSITNRAFQFAKDNLTADKKVENLIRIYKRLLE